MAPSFKQCKSSCCKMVKETAQVRSQGMPSWNWLNFFGSLVQEVHTVTYKSMLLCHWFSRLILRSEASRGSTFHFRGWTLPSSQGLDTLGSRSRSLGSTLGYIPAIFFSVARAYPRNHREPNKRKFIVQKYGRGEVKNPQFCCK